MTSGKSGVAYFYTHLNWFTKPKWF